MDKSHIQTNGNCAVMWDLQWVLTNASRFNHRFHRHDGINFHRQSARVLHRPSEFVVSQWHFPLQRHKHQLWLVRPQRREERHTRLCFDVLSHGHTWTSYFDYYHRFVKASVVSPSRVIDFVWSAVLFFRKCFRYHRRANRKTLAKFGQLSCGVVGRRWLIGCVSGWDFSPSHIDW